MDKSMDDSNKTQQFLKDSEFVSDAVSRGGWLGILPEPRVCKEQKGTFGHAI